MTTTTAPTAFAALLRPIDRRYGTYRGLIRLLLAQAELGAGRLDPFAKPNLSVVQRVVFVCQGNICRSCFAEYCARERGLVTASLGFATAGDAPAFPTAITTARKFDIDLSQHRTTDIEDFDVRDGDLFLTMEVRQARRFAALRTGKNIQIALLGVWANPSRPHIHDPHRLSAEYFETCFAVIHSAVGGLTAQLRAANAPCAAEARA